ncbi:MAG: ABC transporter permease [Gemmatimonadaceae bacterium]|nr:ABC transporter permease [Gemmatimonadaceae bacterium]
MTAHLHAVETSPLTAAERGHSPSGVARIYLLEAKYELLKVLRLPAFIIPSLGFPMMFYALFGLLLPMKASAFPMATYLLATYGAFGVIGIALFSLGIGVATERAQGWLAVKRASPMPLPAYFFGKYAMTVLFSALLVILLCLMGAIFGDVRMPASQWGLLLLVLMLGGIPFCAAGIAVAYLVGPNSAPAVVNAFYLPSAFLSGLFIPAEMLPSFLQSFAQFLPPYHFARLALTVIGVESVANVWIHAGALAGFAFLFTAIAVVAYRRDDGRTYG